MRQAYNTNPVQKRLDCQWDPKTLPDSVMVQYIPSETKVDYITTGLSKIKRGCLL